MSHADNLLVNLERLESHLDSIQGGSLTARDDLASVLQLLVHKGEGYDLIGKAFDELGIPPLLLPAFRDKDISRKYNGKDVHLAIRTANITDDTVLELDAMLDQEVIFHDSSVWSTDSSFGWRKVIANSRNKYGSHVDTAPPEWLKDLRYYPASNSDVMTLLLWSFGEALLGAITAHLAVHKQGVMLYKPRHDLNGISFQNGLLVADSKTVVTVAADFMVTQEYQGQRTILGGTYAKRAFILGLNALRQPIIAMGDPGKSLEDIEHQFITGISPDGLNRAQRRAQRKKS